MEILLSFLAGAALAGIFLWLKNKKVSAALVAAQQQIGRAEEIARANAGLKEENNTLRADLQAAQTEKARLSEREKALERAKAEQEKFIRDIWQEQQEKFRALQEKSEAAFKQITAAAIEQQKTSLVAKNGELYAPLKESLDKFSKQMGDLRTESAAQHSSLKDTLERTIKLNENLSKEAQNLTDALKNTKKQGDWGEIILEDVLTTAGLREGIEFDKQAGLRDAENNLLKPDFIIHLPNKRDLVIDAKMSLTDYVKWVSEPDGAQKEKYLAAHVQSVEKHIKELSETDYPKVLKNERLDFTFMFIPIEYAYFAALSARPDLNAFAKKHRIVIATASNLFGLMQLVENLWRIERSTQTIDRIFKIAQEMHSRVGLFAERMDNLHKQIVLLDKAYEKANTTLLGGQGIVVSAKQLEELGAKSARNLPQPAAESLLPQEGNDTQPPSSGV